MKNYIIIVVVSLIGGFVSNIIFGHFTPTLGGVDVTPQENIFDKASAATEALDTEAKLKARLAPTMPPEATINEIVRFTDHIHEFDGGIWFNTSLGLPPCEETMRGVQWFVKGADGFDDSMVVCARDAKGLFEWHTI